MAQRTLIITECREIHRGRKRTGEEFVVYDVSATREDYTPVHDMKLRSFDPLELHVPLVFEVRPYQTRSGMTYTLFPVGQRSQQKANTPQTSNSGPAIEALERRVAALEAEMRSLKSQRNDGGDVPPVALPEQSIPI